jgi:hypothetical protein
VKQLAGVLTCLIALAVLGHATPHHATYSSPPATATTRVHQNGAR